MFKPFAIIPLVTAVALAQTPSLVPTGISDKCSNFLNDLNSNSDLSGCTAAVIKATSSFSGSAKNSSSSQVTSTLGALCASSMDSACPVDLISGKLTDFYTACSGELTSSRNDDVVRIYDTLFVISPLKVAICSLDDGGNYCSVQAKLPPNTNADSLQAALSSPSASNSAAPIPNAATFSNNGIPFLFLQKPISSDACDVCTRKIMNAYTTFQTQVQYAPGISNSLLLSKQPELYADIKSTCGDSFLDQTGAVKAAGGLSGGTLSGNSATRVNGVAGVVASGMGLLAILVSSML